MSWLASIRGVLIDLSGTLHVGTRAVGESVAALSRLREFGKRNNVTIRFLSNTSQVAKQDVVENLLQMGFVVESDEVTTSLSTLATLVKERQLNPLLLVNPEARSDFDVGENPSKTKNAVVVGLAPKVLDYAAMNEAFNLVLNGAPILAAHKGRYFKDSEGKLSIGPGAFVSGLEFSSGATAEIVGKPSKEFFETAAKEMLGSSNLAMENVVMIGDDLRDDVQGAQRCGMRGCLVRSGKYRDGDDLLVSEDTLVVDDFAAFVERFIDAVESSKS